MFVFKGRSSLYLVVGFLMMMGLQGCDQISTSVDKLVSKKLSKKNSGSIPQGQKAVPPNLLARIGDWTITIEEFNEKLAALTAVIPDYNVKNIDQNKLILEELLRQQLLVQDAEKSGLANKKEVIQAVEEFRKTLLVREVATQITKDITVTDADVQEYYTQNPREFTTPGTWHIRELVVATENEAKAILVKLYQGSDFAAMASQKSKAKSAANGGDLGYVSAFTFPKMGSIVSALDVGGISGIFNGPEGFYIVKLEDKKAGELKGFEELKDQIKTGLIFLKQQQAMLAYLKTLRSQTTVYVNGKLLDSN